MEKSYESNPEKAKYIKESLMKKYPEIFDTYQIKELSDVQICNLFEFLSIERQGIEPRNREELERIFVVVSKEKGQAILVNTNQEGKIPEGEFGIYDLEKQEFKLTNKTLRQKIRENIKKYAKDTLTPQEEEKMIDEIGSKNLEDIEECITMDEQEIDEKVKNAVNQKIDEKNEENGKTKEERMELESKSKKKEQVKVEQEENRTVPEDVARACAKLGITNIKAFMYANGNEFATKTDIPYVNKNRGNVLIIRTEDEGKDTDKYFVFQDGRLCVPGNEDEKIDQVARKSTQNMKNGTFIKPVEIDDEEQYVEYSDSQGLDIKEKLAENMNLSITDLENYKKEIQIELQKYSEELYKIQETAFLTDAQKDALYLEANKRFNTNNEKIAEKYGIHFENVQEINLSTHKQAEEHVMEEDDDFQSEHMARVNRNKNN